jgi:filamentous hemagglutinin
MSPISIIASRRTGEAWIAGSVEKNRSIRFGGQANILSNSGGNQLLKGTKMSYGGSAAFNASVGEKARSDASIILEGIKNSTTQSRTQEANYVVWQKMVNQGSTAETLVLPSFTRPNKPVFTAPGASAFKYLRATLKARSAP